MIKSLKNRGDWVLWPYCDYWTIVENVEGLVKGLVLERRKKIVFSKLPKPQFFKVFLKQKWLLPVNYAKGRQLFDLKFLKFGLTSARILLHPSMQDLLTDKGNIQVAIEQ